MKNTPYQKIIRMMQSEGSAENPPSIQIAVADSANTLQLGEITLEMDDLMLMGGLTQFQQDDTYAVYEMPDDMYLVLGKVVIP